MNDRNRKAAPDNGEVVLIHGYEFIARDVRIIEEGGRRRCEFRGDCTGRECNRVIRKTSHNGGVYGWVIA